MRKSKGQMYGVSEHALLAAWLGKQIPADRSSPKSYPEVKALHPAAPLRPQQTHVSPDAVGDIPTDAMHLQSESKIESCCSPREPGQFRPLP